MRHIPKRGQWIARLGERMPLEAELAKRWNRNFQRQQRAHLHAIAFLLSVVFAWFVGQGMATQLSSDFLVRGSALGATCAVAGVVALLLWFLAYKGVRPHLLGGIAKAGWIAFLPLGFFFGAAALMSHASAKAEPAVRAQIVGIKSHGRTFLRSTSSMLVLRDGSTVAINGRAGIRTRCLLVRRVRGPFGFEWIRIEDGSPPPGPGQLDWPIARDDCFSDRALATLRG